MQRIALEAIEGEERRRIRKRKRRRTRRRGTDSP